MEKKTLIKLTISNKDIHKGYYFAEDDWDLIGYGETFDEALDNLFAVNDKVELVQTVIESVTLEHTDVIDDEGVRYYSNIERPINNGLNPTSIKEMVSLAYYNHPRYTQLKKVWDRLDRLKEHVRMNKNLQWLDKQRNVY